MEWNIHAGDSRKQCWKSSDTVRQRLECQPRFYLRGNE